MPAIDIESELPDRRSVGRMLIAAGERGNGSCASEGTVGSGVRTGERGGVASSMGGSSSIGDSAGDGVS
jgi:hypothetical protein